MLSSLDVDCRQLQKKKLSLLLSLHVERREEDTSYTYKRYIMEMKPKLLLVWIAQPRTTNVISIGSGLVAAVLLCMKRVRS